MTRVFISSCIIILCLPVFAQFKKPKPRLPEEYVSVPPGSYYTATPEEDPYYFGMTRNIKPMDSSKIWYTKGFHMSKYEISNQQYRQFYNEVATAMTEEERIKIRCDSVGWKRVGLYYNEPYTLHYYNHPAFTDFPVVNITYEGALQYCAWLQQKIQRDNPGYIIEVRLPEKYEWTWAAMGGRHQAVYPWGNYYLRNRKGEFLCNFKRMGDQSIVRNRNTGQPEVINTQWSQMSESGFYTMNVKSYAPNDYGLYNICGNAAEMIAEKGIAMGGSWDDFGGDITTRSEATYTGFINTVGFRPVIIVKAK